MSRARSRGRSRRSVRWGGGTSPCRWLRRLRARQLAELGARVSSCSAMTRRGTSRADASADVSSPSGPHSAAPTPGRSPRRTHAAARRSAARRPRLRPRRRSRLRGGDCPEYEPLEPSRRPVPAAAGSGPRVHCWWTFDSLEDGRGRSSRDAFGEPARTLGERLTRPRLSYNVAIYHRTIGRSADAEPAGSSRSSPTATGRRAWSADAATPPGGRARASLSPGLVFLAIALVGSIVYMAFAITVRDASQIPLLASRRRGARRSPSAALAVYCLRASWRAGTEGRGGRAVLLALVGGVAGDRRRRVRLPRPSSCSSSRAASG